METTNLKLKEAKEVVAQFKLLREQNKNAFPPKKVLQAVDYILIDEAKKRIKIR